MTITRDLKSRRRMIGVALGVESIDAARSFLESDAGGADVVEVRLDHFRQSIDVADLIHISQHPVIVTNRPPREGGRSPLTEAARVATLCAAADAGAAFVDVEWDVATASTIARLHSSGTQVIASRHAFDRMPLELDDWARELADSGTDVVKVVGTAGDAIEVKPVLDVLSSATVPTIAIAMGTSGMASRVLALRYESCLLTFAAPNGQTGTAPGQISIAQIRQVFHASTLNPATEVFGVLGPSIQPELIASLNALIAHAGRDAVVVPFPTVGPIARVISAFRVLPIRGWLLTPRVGIKELRTVVNRFDVSSRSAGTVSMIVLQGLDLVAMGHDEKPEWIVGEWLGRSTAPPRATSNLSPH